MNILIAISGSIAAYKTPDLCRGLINQGHKVKVVLTHGALKFVNSEVFKYLGVEETYLPDDDFKHKNVRHIDLSKWLDTFVLVPSSANTLARLSQGMCEDMLGSIFLSLEHQKVKIIYPAMNTHMFRNTITQGNLSVLKTVPNLYIVTPEKGILACGDEGEGKLPDVRGIIEMIPTYSNKNANKKVLITAGATLSSIDTVRYVTNPARGGTSYLLAKKYLSEGYQVHVIKGQDVIESFKHLNKHPNYSDETISSTQDLLDTVKKQYMNYDFYISPMAVSDIEFEFQNKKIKKLSMNGAFNFKSAPDVLKFVVENRLPHQKIVGFAAESDLNPSTINEKITRKPVDLLVANLVDSGFNGTSKKGFGTSRGHYKLVTKTETEEFSDLSKVDLVDLIFKKIN